MEEQLTADQLGWRAVRQMLAGIGWGLLGIFLLVLAVFLPFVDWLRTCAMGEVSPAHDLLTGHLRSYWGVVLLTGLGAFLQLRLLVLGVIRIRYCWRGYRQAGSEWGALCLLDDFRSKRRRDEMKKRMEQYLNGMFSQAILAALAVAVLAMYGLILFVGGRTSSPVAPQVHIPALRAELEQVENGPLETAEVWVHPKAETGRLPRMWGSGYRSLVRNYHVVGLDTGGQWVEIFVPDAMGFSPDMEHPYRESQPILWNLEHARRYRVSYTSNFHLVTEITPVNDPSP